MTELMRRRRALMEVAANSGTPITTLTAGSAVKVLENGSLANFVYIGTNSAGNALLLRAEVLSTQKAFNSQSQKPEYENCQIDTWLTGTILQYYTGLTNYLVNSDITYANYNDSYVETIKTISRKIFIPSLYEMGGGGNEGGVNFVSALRTYTGATSDSNARKVASGYHQWLRTEYSNSSYQNRVSTVSNLGAVGGTNFQQSNSTTPKARPVLSLSPNTPITTSGSDIIVGGAS